MFIPEFWLGVIATLLTEFGIITVFGIMSLFTDNKDDQNRDN